MSATETSTANEAARPETPSLFSRLRRFLTGVKSRTSEPSVIQEKSPRRLKQQQGRSHHHHHRKPARKTHRQRNRTRLSLHPAVPTVRSGTTWTRSLKILHTKSFPTGLRSTALTVNPPSWTDSTVSKWWMAPARMTKRSWLPLLWPPTSMAALSS
ncbi:hypothetical protein ECDEC6A_5580 [Escherichia coli DEC6A]|nr:hypothetical protein ECDEC6A_5580 [Escherichia coli DEC6A]